MCNRIQMSCQIGGGSGRRMYSRLHNMELSDYWRSIVSLRVMSTVIPIN